MWSPTDQSHFRKYIATLGVAIVVGALGLGGWYLQAQSDLLVDQSKLAQLTPTAQAALRQKQYVILLVANFAPYVVLALVVVGVVMTVLGLVGWRQRQRVLDQKEDLERDKLKHEVDKLTQREKEEQAQQEARELISTEIVELARSVSAADSASVAESASVDVIPESPIPVAVSQALDSNSVEKMASHVLEVHATLAKKLSVGLPHANVQPEVRVRRRDKDGALRETIVDVLVEPKVSRSAPIWVCEVRIVRFLDSAMGGTLISAITAADIVGGDDGYDPLPVVVFVIDKRSDAATSDMLSQRVARKAAEMASAFSRQLVVLVYESDEFEAIEPDRLVGAIRRGAKHHGLLS